jgi:hypothetical protein
VEGRDLSQRQTQEAATDRDIGLVPNKPVSVQELQTASHTQAPCELRVRLFREPDAGNPPVRFDEREQETELRQTGLRWRGESQSDNHRETNTAAPVLDSTRHPIINPGLLE